MVIYWLLYFIARREQSASCPMFIRGFPVYRYLLTVYTTIFAYVIAHAYFIAHCERSASGPKTSKKCALCDSLDIRPHIRKNPRDKSNALKQGYILLRKQNPVHVHASITLL